MAAGSVTGAQFPLVVTDSSGISDLAGNAWDLSCDGQTATNPTPVLGYQPSPTDKLTSAQWKSGIAAWLDLQTGFGKVQNDLGPAEAPAPGEDVVEVKARTAYGDITVRRGVNAG